MKEMRDIQKAGNIIRKIFLKAIRPNYRNEQLKKRKGNCRRCGQCCGKCHYYKDNLCIVYENRPWFCYKDFPLDKLDQKTFGVKNCRYVFE